MTLLSSQPPADRPFAEAARRIPDDASALLESTSVPGNSGRFLLGHTFDFLWRTQPMLEELRLRYGANYRTRIFGMPVLILGSPGAAREVLLDRDKNFSSERGWHRSIGKLFARGLMLLDFEDHRVDRRIMQSAFRGEAMRGYVESMHAPVRDAVARWPRKLPLYPALKELTLGLAARIFLGLPLDRRSSEINRAFVAVVAASLALVRREVPGLAYARGMRGRRTLERFFAELIRERRAGAGTDLLSELCRARSDQGEHFSDRAIGDHMIFLMMAAHDTTTSALSSIVQALIENPDWQERVRDESRARGDAPISWEERDALPALNRCFDEALRLYPPLPMIARRNVRACTVEGLEIPANSNIAVTPLLTHRLPEYWAEPNRFDPDRFSPDRAEHTAHSHLYYPFGGGAHVCIGLHFARMQVKAVLRELLMHYRIREPITAALRGHWRLAVPISKPLDGLPVILEAH